jgi:hypothetical protein
MTHINFLGIGARRSGTSWIFRCIEEHPEVCTSRIKEVPFFEQDIFFEKGPGYYAHFYSHCKEGTVRGDFNPNYLSSPPAPQRIKGMFPEAKLIASLRNPIEGLYSMYHFGKFRGKFSYTSFETFLEQEPAYIEERMYGKHLQHFLAYFPKEQLLVVLYEDIERNPEAFMQRIYAFIGVDPYFVAKSTHERVNAGANYAIFAFSRLLYKMYRLLQKTRFGNKGTELIFRSRAKVFIDRLFELNRERAPKRTERNTMRPETRARLQKRFAEDIASLENIIGRDLSFWK